MSLAHVYQSASRLRLRKRQTLPMMTRHNDMGELADARADSTLPGRLDKRRVSNGVKSGYMTSTGNGLTPNSTDNVG